MQEKYDYVIIGSGFGGSVSALRLAEKGYKVLVIEKGKWFTKDDFPKTNWNFKKWLWLPSLNFFGIQKVTFFRHVSVLSGVGVGGGSLVYANTLPKPKIPFFNHGSWTGLADWERELNPHYETAWKMLGAEVNPYFGQSDLAFKQLAKEIGKEDGFDTVKVAIHFGEKEKTVADPYFNGKGPDRTGCILCGSCMTGCRHNAKNTLDKNYLYLAQKLGAEVIAEHEVTEVIPLNGKDGADGYEIVAQTSTKTFKNKKRITSKGVIFSGGVLGTIPLLLKQKKTNLPNLSNRLGEMVRTNNEALILTVTADKNKDMSDGIAIGSILETDENTHIEPVRYGNGSGAWRLLIMPMVSEKNFFLRILKLFLIPFSAPLMWLNVFFAKDFAKQTTVILFMQHLDSTLKFRKGLIGMKSKIETGKNPTAFIPEAHEIAHKYAKIINGKPTVMFTETVTGIPSTAHILGGAVIGKDIESGVIDKNNRVFGYENMLVCDGSAISANPGVNPALTITAMSERAMSLIEKKNNFDLK
ncbi:MAG: GMC family oxidoreductase [Bacteroidales bacterium]|nr:GMC family oxidoreductase [Bacteroidales bacterium]MBN2757752.1 GMC family oxidoreductase [Bacteroidales bacterium]